jgi:hypothetical protein
MVSEPVSPSMNPPEAPPPGALSAATLVPVRKLALQVQVPSSGGAKWTRQTPPEVAEVSAASPSAAK